MNNLFFDIAITGHHAEYIDHLITYLVASNDHKDDNHYFIMHPDFSEQFPVIVNKLTKKPNVKIISVSEEELKEANKGGLVRKSFKNYVLMNNYAKQLNVDTAYLLYFNIFQLALAFFRPQYKVKGILFMPFNRLKTIGAKAKISYVRKYIQTYLYAKNKKITSIFVLNDDKTVQYFNKKMNSRNIFKTLPDPIPILTPLPNYDIYGEYNIDIERKVFLHIGSLSERKGTMDILDCINEIAEEYQKKICFLFVGKLSDDFKKIFMEKVVFYQQNSSVQIIHDNNFVSNEKMRSLFDKSDCILIPYKNSEGSSGILGHAAMAGKPVIGPKRGLLGELIQENNLGYAVYNIDELAKTISFIANNNQSALDNKSFVDDKTSKIFAKTILL